MIFREIALKWKVQSRQFWTTKIKNLYMSCQLGIGIMFSLLQSLHLHVEVSVPSLFPSLICCVYVCTYIWLEQDAYHLDQSLLSSQQG